MYECHRCGNEIDSREDLMDGDDYGYDEVCRDCLDELKEENGD